MDKKINNISYIRLEKLNMGLNNNYENKKIQTPVERRTKSNNYINYSIK